MTVPWRSRLVAAAGLAALVVLVPAGPAMAAPPTISYLSPGSGQFLDDGSVTISARVTINGTISDPVSLKVTSARPTITATTGAGASPHTVSFPVNLAYNGAYTATITAKGRPRSIIGLGPEETATASVEFVVAAPPARPTGVKTAVDAAARSVTVTWEENAEPDLIRYEVKRARGTSNDFSVVARPKAGETSITDATTAVAGGDYRYLVVAVRTGAPGGEDLSSDPSAVSADAVAKVPDPPLPPTTVSAGAGAGAGSGTASPLPASSPGALATSGSVDLSGFNAVRNQARATGPRSLVLPDPGFQSTLPFASPDGEGADDPEVTGDTGDLGELAADDLRYRELGDEAAGDDRTRTMAFFAGGLLATVLLMHVLWVKSEVRRVPLEALDPDGPGAAAGRGDGWAAGAGGRSGAGATGGPTLDDSGADDFAPVVVATETGRGGSGGGAGRSAGRSGGSRRQKVSTGG